MTRFAKPEIEWSAETEMSNLEAAFWRAEVDPRLRSGGVVMEVLDGVPDWGRLVAAHAWAVRLAPRLRCRVVDDPLHLGPPVWVLTDIDLEYHLVRVSLDVGAGIDGLLELAATLHMEAFDRSRPLWRAVLVDGLPGGTSAYLLKLHHSMSDGQGTVQLFDLLHSTRREPTPDKPAPPLAPSQSVSPASLAARRSHDAVIAAPRDTRRVAGSVLSRAVKIAAHPQSIGSGVAYVKSLAKVAAPDAGTPSPLFDKRGVDRRLRIAEVPLADLKGAGAACGGTINDAFLAGLLGGLGRYHRRHEVEVGDLPTALPVSLRSTGDALGGNRFAAATIAGPAGEWNPALRVKQIHERVRSARLEPALDFMGATASIASRLPDRVLAKLALRMSKSIDLQASNIPGLDREAYMAGARITETYVFGPVPGCAIMATLYSHEGTCYVGITTDHDAVPDPDALIADIKDGLAEVVATGQGHQ
jgi:diacylglycerol O-acyltransferase / wax synthase